MNVGSAALVHHLSLFLRIEVLSQLAHDPEYLSLPGLELRRVLLKEVEDVFLRQVQGGTFLSYASALRLRMRRALRHGALPEIVVAFFFIAQASALSLLDPANATAPLAMIAVHSLVHQRVGGIEQSFDGLAAIAFLAASNVALSEFQIVENGLYVGPLPEEVIVTEEVVVAES